MRPRETETTDEETPTPPPPTLEALSADEPPPQPPSQVSPTNGAGPSSMAARDSEPAADPKEPLSTTTTNSPNRLMSEPLPPDGRRSGSLPSDRRPVSPPAGSRRSPDFRRRGSSPPRELNRRRSRSPFLTEFNRRRRRSPPLTEFGRRGHNSSPLTENAWHGNHGFRELRRTPPHRGMPLEGFRCRGSPPRMTEFRRRGSPPLAEVRRRGSPPLAEFRRHRSPLMVDAHPYGRGSGDRGMCFIKTLHFVLFLNLSASVNLLLLVCECCVCVINQGLNIWSFQKTNMFSSVVYMVHRFVYREINEACVLAGITFKISNYVKFLEQILRRSRTGEVR